MIAQQWQFTYRYPAVRRRRDVRAGAPGRPHGRVPRHVARRDPLVLGLPARRQGRRGARRRQHRVHDAEARGPVRDPLRRAVRPVARLHVRPRARALAGRVRERWIAHAQRANAPSTHYLPKYASVYYPDPLREGRMSAPETPTAARGAGSSGRSGLLTFNLLWGIVGLVVGYAIGLWIGHRHGLALRLGGRDRLERHRRPARLRRSGRSATWPGSGFLNHPIARLFGTLRRRRAPRRARAGPLLRG